MNRQIVYAGQIPQDTDILNGEKNDYVGLCKLAQALFGNATTVNGLSCVPNTPAALNVVVNPGEIYSLQQLDPTAYGSLGTDTTHSVLKQGVLMDAVTLATPAPGTGGFSINYLVQATFVTADANSTVLPYYNASNPAVAWSGPGNSGAAQFTQRQDLCQVTVKAGTAAATGTQVTPAPDAGNVGLWVVTVANGAVTVVAGNITAYSAAPFLHGSQNNPLFQINNLTATTNPGVSNDNTQGYAIGSKWLNTATNTIFMCSGATTGSAIWVAMGVSAGRNFIVDPCCRVAQDSASFSLTTAYKWGNVDLVQCKATGTLVSAGTITQDTAGTAGGATAYSTKLAGVTITGTGKVFFRRFIESRDAIALKNQTVFFSVLGLQDTGTTVPAFLTINKATAQDNFASVTNIATGSNVSMASNSGTAITAAVSMGDCSNGVEIILEMDCGAVTTKNFYATDWQACMNALPLLCAVPRFDDDYLAAMRYYEQSYPYGTAHATVTESGCVSSRTAGNTGTGTRFFEVTVLYRVPKVAAATPTLYSSNTGATARVWDDTTTANVVAIIGTNASTGFIPTNNSGGTITAGDRIVVQYTADARL